MTMPQRFTCPCGRVYEAGVDLGDGRDVMAIAYVQLKEEPPQTWRTARECGICKVRDIPYGVEWPFWHEGQCVHPQCLERLLRVLPDPPPCLGAEVERLRGQIEGWQANFCKVVQARDAILEQRDALLAAARHLFETLHGDLWRLCTKDEEAVVDALRAAVATCEPPAPTGFACEVCGRPVREGLRVCAGLSECWRTLFDREHQGA